MKQITVSLNKSKKIIYHDHEDNIINIISNEVFEVKEYEKGYLAVKDRKNPVILDIGAHIGMSTLYFSQIEGAKIYSFEPCAKNYEYLVKNTQGLNNVKTFNFGVGVFNTDKRDFAKETFYCKEKGMAVEELVKSRTIEWIIDSEKLDHIDLIKIDVEGAEYEIFSTDPFKKVAPKIDYIVGESHWGVNPFVPQDLIPLLSKLGFNTEFLPFKNWIKGWEVVFTGEKNESYKVNLTYTTPTMFFSNKI